ncbi:Ionotropic glutamate receptor [Trinorchestia longiramus]|nr:Ionotropic glutamate receptor [Trinorchestia longiramus]
MKGPFAGYPLLFSYDNFSSQVIEIDSILKATQSKQPVNIHMSEKYQPLQKVSKSALPAPEIQKGNIIAVLITKGAPTWLNDYVDTWVFQSVVIVNLNSHSKVQSFTSNTVIKRSKNLLLIETHENHFDNGEVSLFSINTIFPDAEHKTLLGYWEETKFSEFDDVFPDRFSDFNGTVVEIASDVDDNPLIIKTKTGTLTGMNIEIVKALSKWLNFRYTTTIAASDDHWGEYENGTYNGLLGDVLRGEKNFTMNYLTLTLDRVKYFDVSVPYFWEGFGFVLKNPPPLPAWQNLLFPFTWQVWMSVAMALVLFPLVIFVFVCTRRDSPRAHSITDLYVFAVMSLLRQTVPVEPRGWAGRYVVIGWLWASVLITLFYTSNLVAVLTVPVFSRKLVTIADLAKDPIRTTMLDYGEFVPGALAESTDPKLRKLGDKMDLFTKNENNLGYYYYGIRMVAEGTHALTETSSYLRLLMARKWNSTEGYYFLKEQIYSGSLAFFFQKYTPWKYKFDKGLQNLLETGLLNKWYVDYMNQKNDDKVDHVAKSLSLYHLQGPFLILSIGWGLSSCFFIVEYLIGKNERKSFNN